MSIAAVVLAAGRATRAGGLNKLTAEVGGVALAARAVDAVLASPARPVIVVTGHEAEALRAALAGRDVAFVHNPRHADGMGTSIAAGIKAVPGEASGALICLADMPLVAGADIARLVAAFDPEAAPICVPVAQGRRGNPVLFAKRFFPALEALSGDAGAKALIAAHAGKVREVAMDGAGVLTDLDTAAEIAAFNRGGGDRGGGGGRSEA